VTPDDELAVILLSHLDTPIMDDVLNTDRDGINWDLLVERYLYLSHGEQAIVDLACSVTGRPALAYPHQGNHRPLQSLLNAVSEDVREVMCVVLHRLATR
jgi:hypothetical protein